MTEDSRNFQPIPTCEIPPPILEGLPAGEGDAGEIPRILLQSVGSERAERQIMVLSAIFVILAILILILIIHIPKPEALVVYGDFPRTMLLEDLK